MLRKRRELPLAGRVLVALGDVVKSETVVAEAQREGELRVVRVSEQLSVSPKEALSRITIGVGDVVNTGQVIAEVRGLWGLFRSTVEAPLSGVVEFISEATGHVGIRAPATRFRLNAYIDGVVSHVDADRGVVIEASATFIQGIFGVGGERTGTLCMLPIEPDMVVQAEHIPADCKGAILVGGHSPTIDALEKARARGATGFVTGSIDDVTLRQYVGYDIGIALTGDEPVSMTLIITEGFGALPMKRHVVSMLSACAGARVSINGATQVRAGALRPEIITVPSVFQGASSGPEQASQQEGLIVGRKVRIIRVPYFGVHGTVSELPRELVQIETGAYARVAKVSLEGSSQQVIVPRANLELV
jgi:hypothetical protein